jgi:hypothetical protein
MCLVVGFIAGQPGAVVKIINSGTPAPAPADTSPVPVPTDSAGGAPTSTVEPAESSMLNP